MSAVADMTGKFLIISLSFIAISVPSALLPKLYSILAQEGFVIIYQGYFNYAAVVGGSAGRYALAADYLAGILVNHTAGTDEQAKA
jgi:hypothetical protein